MKATRLNDIENLLEEQNTLSINHLCEIFNVSKNTIRRDIAELEKRGTIKKVYGGIMRNQTNIPEPFAAREIKNKTKKKQLAKLAANLVDDNDIIYIDSGTTTMHMIPYLAEKKNLTILTANVYKNNNYNNSSLHPNWRNNKEEFKKAIIAQIILSKRIL